ncbi:MAG: M48 family metallopeptidase [Actinomycetota bacterium]
MRLAVVATLLVTACVIVVGQPALAAASHLDPHKYFSKALIDRANSYTHPLYFYALASALVGFIAAAVIALGPVARAIGAWASRMSGERWALTTLVLAAVVTLVPAVVTFPFSFFGGLLHDRKFGLSMQSALGFVSDSIKSSAFQIVIVSIAALGFFFIVRRLPRMWPVFTSAFLVGLTVALVIAYPLVYEPLFNKFKPVDPATRDRIVKLAREAGVSVDRVLVADASRRTTKLNAYVSGLGSTKRVVLYDTLLDTAPPAQVDLVVAHELGHVVHNDVWRGTLLGCLGAIGLVLVLWLLLTRQRILTLIGANGPGDPRALPFIVLVVGIATFLTLPIANAFSRSIEARADRFAVQLTRDPQTAVQTEINLAVRNVSDLNPNGFIRWLYFTHPSTMERIEIAIDEGRKLGSLGGPRQGGQ